MIERLQKNRHGLQTFKDNRLGHDTTGVNSFSKASPEAGSADRKLPRLQVHAIYHADQRNTRSSSALEDRKEANLMNGVRAASALSWVTDSRVRQAHR